MVSLLGEYTEGQLYSFSEDSQSDPTPVFKSAVVINLVTFSSFPWGWAKIDVPLISSLFKWDMYTNQITFHALENWKQKQEIREVKMGHYDLVSL